ncbi:hypothetical protein TEQG_07275 [Trichophyton equinum CBS 127.97]|uniref:Uncharacterized protein n=1 Tax=Trichophyton equinum (strain ATCC MYA-4606 / CBS 127.97) TaxID=559882 RepID=F2Q249_TRIEC|nr:hypothetical protein TEQG_07275 [Trichophyton equinum CBS 127.97]
MAIRYYKGVDYSNIDTLSRIPSLGANSNDAPRDALTTLMQAIMESNIIEDVANINFTASEIAISQNFTNSVRQYIADDPVLSKIRKHIKDKDIPSFHGHDVDKDVPKDTTKGDDMPSHLLLLTDDDSSSGTPLLKRRYY